MSRSWEKKNIIIAIDLLCTYLLSERQQAFVQWIIAE